MTNVPAACRSQLSVFSSNGDSHFLITIYVAIATAARTIRVAAIVPVHARVRVHRATVASRRRARLTFALRWLLVVVFANIVAIAATTTDTSRWTAVAPVVSALLVAVAATAARAASLFATILSNGRPTAIATAAATSAAAVALKIIATRLRASVIMHPSSILALRAAITTPAVSTLTTSVATTSVAKLASLAATDVVVRAQVLAVDHKIRLERALCVRDLREVYERRHRLAAARLRENLYVLHYGTHCIHTPLCIHTKKLVSTNQTLTIIPTCARYLVQTAQRTPPIRSS